MTGSLSVAELSRRYGAGTARPEDVVNEVYDRIAARGDDHVWITLRPREEVLAEAAALPDGPLYGVPYAVKDNIDVAGLPTTAACPEFAYTPDKSAPIVERLRSAGALLIGKTNLDQFATGLSGTRSPYGSCESPLVPGLISGGSSSGSAVAVGAGLVSFALGTDTAGSGRVPAAFTGTVGLKPSRGLVSTLGMVPACASLDCASVFAASVADAWTVLTAIAGPVGADPWSRSLPVGELTPTGPLRIGVPRRLEFFGDGAAAVAFKQVLARLCDLGHTLVQVEFVPFLQAGKLLYGGAWVAERLTAVGAFAASNPRAVHPVTRRVLRPGASMSAADAFADAHRLQELRAETRDVWRRIDALAVPTIPTTFTHKEMREDPIGRNKTLGHYSTFANLLDLAAIAVPGGMTPAGRPHGLTLLAPAGKDALLASAAAAFAAEPIAAPVEGVDEAVLAVVGAHRAGQPLHGRLTALGARPHGVALTASAYRLFALPGGDVARPGLVRVGEGGAAVEVELYALSAASLGHLLTETAPPLGLGTVELADGRSVHGFLCESYATGDARDISGHGSWPAYLEGAHAQQ
ncbi:allophanate hydrolase [Actinocorallia sp. A-T 12471]|uniref:allophanate hydrolase n=1 Tax=Actinocorallia sp. A-T 12471 TaxID=3089813 RepID=UPI0029CC21A4|nr:allophanate hydrolase [Actinocorallia sp. A-T 12471]MDX6741313.1 allophanate hydrolase [Actinocorallia sp. A-T 12471]